jgi:hypothetical protein
LVGRPVDDEVSFAGIAGICGYYFGQCVRNVSEEKMPVTFIEERLKKHPQIPAIPAELKRDDQGIVAEKQGISNGERQRLV